MKKPETFSVSFEFFPPKTAEGASKLRAVRQKLSVFRPDFCSVTYGAGGSTQQGTLDTVAEMLAEGMKTASHLSCIGSTRDGMRAQLLRLHGMGVCQLVALRGDLPSGYGHGGEFQHAVDLVEFIRNEQGNAFSIAVAAYPEIHPQARSPQDDLKAFADKVRAGADLAITQYFFNPDAYFRFMDDIRGLGVDIPVLPGIMPIVGASSLLRFSDACGAEVPRWVRQRLQGFGDDNASIRAFGIEVVSAFCEKLLAGGAPGLHFYTMNQSVATQSICQNIGLTFV